jgi:hypothetical protein
VVAGDSKTPCIYAGLQSNLAAAEQATGLTYNCLETFSTPIAAWSNWTAPWVTSPSYGYTAWLAADPTGRTVVLTQDLVATDQVTSDASWRGHCAQGQFAPYATQLAQNLIAAGFGNSVVRLGAEMNGSWESDYIGTSTGEQHNWALCFAVTVRAMRAVAGAHFLFDWNVVACGNASPLANYYPGDAYVNIIGVDAYDTGCPAAPPPASAATFASVANNPEGLLAVSAFAQQNGEPMSIPEWATSSPTGSPPGYGDDPYYVAGIGQYVASSSNFSFQTWFDAGDNGVLELSSANPKSLQAYVAAFG